MKMHTKLIMYCRTNGCFSASRRISMTKMNIVILSRIRQLAETTEESRANQQLDPSPDFSRDQDDIESLQDDKVCHSE
ncbi:hypothetical protein COY15_00300 [Candidatus Roizmanbacteria bacterium CG_4_10_14_0_2_um_filter_39_12]|nr:MAG: hypothetical protein COY15_00300 [Candidatus Roizmanbacteria bacterium CG_4_10_14_0_2_um_filter_39_12]